MDINKQYADIMCSVEWRKKTAAKYNLAEQEIIDLPRDKYEILIAGLEIGEKYGAKKVIEHLKKEMTTESEEENENGNDN